MTYILLALLVIVFLIFWGVYKIIKAIFRKAKCNQQDRKRSEERAKVAREIEEFESSVVMTEIVEKRKVFDSSRKYHYETTFMLYFKNEQKAALTVENGSYHYDFLMSKCTGGFSV